MIKKNTLTLVITIITSVLLGYAPIFAQTTYYVSSSIGNNNNVGTNPFLPLQTLSEVSSRTFNPGDIIKFRRGDIWEGEVILQLSSTKHKGITISDYSFGQGSSDKPIFNNMSNLIVSWQIHSTNNGHTIWKAITNRYIVRLFNTANQEFLQSTLENDLGTMSIGLSEAPPATPNQTLQKWFFKYVDGTSNEIYFATPIGELPPTNLMCATSYYTIIFDYDTDDVTIENIDVRGSFGPSIWVRNSDNVTIQNCTLGKYSETGIKFLSKDGGNCNKPIIQNNLIDSAWGNTPLHYGVNSTGSNISSKRGVGDGINFVDGVTNGKITNNTLYNWGHTAIEFLAQSSSLNGVNNNTVSNNYISGKHLSYGRAIGVDGIINKCEGNEFKYNYVTHCKAQIQFNGNNNLFHHNIVRITENSPCKPNVVNGGGRGMEMAIYGPSLVCQNNMVDNNLFEENDSWGISVYNYFGGISSPPQVSNISIRNNIFINNSDADENNNVNVAIRTDNISDSSINNIKIQNNLFYDFDNPNDPNLILYRGSNIDVVNGSASMTNNDILSNNLHDDPELTYDNELTSSSPCIDSGFTALGYINDPLNPITDYDGDTFPFNGTADIGPQEYQGSSRLAAYVKDKIQENALRVYPNPTRDYLHINTIYTVKSVEVFDISNRLMNLKYVNNGLDLSTVNSGVYTIRIITDQGTFSKKIIKQ